MTPFYLSSAPTIFRKPCSARYTLDARRALEFQILQDTLSLPPPSPFYAACFSFRSARSLVCHERLSRRDQLVPFFLRRKLASFRFLRKLYSRNWRCDNLPPPPLPTFFPRLRGRNHTKGGERGLSFRQWWLLLFIANVLYDFHLWKLFFCICPAYCSLQNSWFVVRERNERNFIELLQFLLLF